MNTNRFYNDYFASMFHHIQSLKYEDLDKCVDMILKCNKNNNKVIIVGNGGSSSIASHVSVDFTKAANIRSMNFNESALITCFANDYGYENWVSNALKFYADKNDVVIMISSSGMSANIIEGAKEALNMGLKLITLSGFTEKNLLKSMGDVNLWLNSSHYNYVEMSHHIWLLAIVDKIIEMNKKRF